MWFLPLTFHSYEKGLFEDWAKQIDTVCSFNISKPLLIRNGAIKRLEVNFDPELASVLREVKYLQIRGKEQVPAAASALFEQNDKLCQFRITLDQIAKWYNYLATELIEIEDALIVDQLAEIDRQLNTAETTLSWRDEEAWNYIQSTRDMTRDLERRVVQTQENIVQIRKIMKSWARAPLFERKEGKREALLGIEEREDRRCKRYSEIREAGERENRKLFKADVESDAWKRYVNYVDHLVEEGLRCTLECSLKYILAETEDKQTTMALFEAQMELQTPEVIFIPSLVYGTTNGFYELVDGLIVDIYKQASLIPRIDANATEESYQAKMEEVDVLNEMRQTLLDRTQSVIQKALAYQATFDVYAYLWVDDRAEFMRHFLIYGRVLSVDELETLQLSGPVQGSTLVTSGMANGEGEAAEGLVPHPPTLKQFKEQIDNYERIFEEVDKLEASIKFDSWFRIVLRRFKHALLNIIKRWSLMFKQHLIDHVTTSLNDLANFIKVNQNYLRGS
ncbi:unnamed protein product [Protopolystoma xenopodis]|uniref:Dynein heavy chain tail domain-containing protein n=1 Tax=Protopolystoma xenopodis TaxID=117903 RepID=A0A3S5CB55_9PLAT|nr:unnamed protein product [Protopolystoma xenopodis]